MSLAGWFAQPTEFVLGKQWLQKIGLVEQFKMDGAKLFSKESYFIISFSLLYCSKVYLKF
jgi:hypothetical protein